jgi:Tol biopolymer transport system component
VEVSPDGSRLAVSVQTASDIRMFAYDLRRGSLSRIAGLLDGEAIVAAWSRDNRIAVQVVHAGKVTAAIVSPDDASAAQPVGDSNGFWAGSWSPDGRLVGMKDGHLWLYKPADAVFRPAEVVATRALETQPAWSPDGRWLAYTSDVTGRLEVHLRPFPGTGEAVMVSLNGGRNPAWNPNGRELFYTESEADQDRMMAVNMAASGRPGTPAPLFSFPHDGLFVGTAILTPYAVSPDGQRFYAVRSLPRVPTRVTDINLVLNWFDELNAKAGVRGR